MNHRDNFYYQVSTFLNADEQLMQEFSYLTDEANGFYELCQKFLDIALNAIKGRVDGEIVAYFQFSDVAIAKEATMIYTKEYEIQDLSAFLDIIKKLYPRATQEKESRPLVHVEKNENSSRDAVSLFGKYYKLTIIPDDVFEEIKGSIIGA